MAITVVYIDDEAGLCEVFKDIFDSEQVNVTTYIDPEEAIAAINLNPPDLVFIDYRLPRTTGDIVAGRIVPNVPKVLVTGDLAVVTESKFVKMFPKPYDFGELEKYIEEFAAAKTRS